MSTVNGRFCVIELDGFLFDALVVKERSGYRARDFASGQPLNAGQEMLQRYFNGSTQDVPDANRRMRTLAHRFENMQKSPGRCSGSFRRQVFGQRRAHA